MARRGQGRIAPARAGTPALRRGLPLLVGTLAACAPQPLVPVDVAEAQCVRAVLNEGGNTAVTIGVGAGGGGLGWGGYGWGGGTGVAVSTTLPVATGGNPEADYNSCVLRRSGQMPDTSLSERPEVKG